MSFVAVSLRSRARSPRWTRGSKEAARCGGREGAWPALPWRRPLLVLPGPVFRACPGQSLLEGWSGPVIPWPWLGTPAPPSRPHPGPRGPLGRRWGEIVGGTNPLSLLSPFSTQLGAAAGEKASGDRQLIRGPSPVHTGPPAPRSPHTATSLSGTLPAAVQPRFQGSPSARLGLRALWHLRSVVLPGFTGRRAGPAPNAADGHLSPAGR